VSRLGTHRQRGRLRHAQVEASARYVEKKDVRYIKGEITLYVVLK